MTALQSNLMQASIYNGRKNMSRFYHCHVVAMPLTARVQARRRIRSLTVRSLAKRSETGGAVRLEGRPAGKRGRKAASGEGVPSITSLHRMAKAELQDALTQRGLDTSGTKPVLVDRLWGALSAVAEGAPVQRDDGDTEAAGSMDPHAEAAAAAEEAADEKQASDDAFTSPTQLQQLKKGELQELLSHRGLQKTGNKGALVERLWAAMQQDTADSQTSPVAAAASAPEAPAAPEVAPVVSGTAQPLAMQDRGDQDAIVRSGRQSRASRVRVPDDEARAGPGLPTAMAAAPDIPPTGRSSVVAPDESMDDLELVQDEGDVDQLLDVEYEDDAVEDQLENDFGDMPGAAQVMQDIAARRSSTGGGSRSGDWVDEDDKVMATDEADVSWLRPGSLDESAAQRFARYTEGFSVEDEDAPPLPVEEDEEERAAAEAAAAADAAELSPEALAPGDGSATDRDLEELGALADGETQVAADEPYQMEDGDLGIDEEELARLEAELGSADGEDFDGGRSSTLEQLEAGSALPGAGVAALEDHGAVTDAAADPLVAAGGSDDPPLAPTYEPDGMAQLDSVDRDADDVTAGAVRAMGTESVDALSGMDPVSNLTDAAAGFGATPAELEAVLNEEPDAAVAEDIRHAAAKADADAATAAQMDTFVAETDSAMAAEEAEPADEANLAADGTAQPAAPPAAADVKPADITAELAQQSVEARPSIPSSGVGTNSISREEPQLAVDSTSGVEATQDGHPLVEADNVANPLTASAAATAPGDAGLSAESAGEVMREALAQEADEIEDLSQKTASKEAALAIMRESVQRSEATGLANAESLAMLAVQVAELRSAQLDWQQNVLQGRLATLRGDSERISANDQLKEELSATLSDLEGKMAALDAELTARAAEAEKLQETLEAATGEKVPPPPSYNGTKVRAAIGGGGGGGTNAPAGGSVAIDDQRLRAPLAAAAAAEVPASRRPAGGKAFGVAVVAGVMGALDAGRGFLGSLMRPKGDEQRGGGRSE